MPDSPLPSSTPPGFLRRADQVCVAAVIGISWIAIAAYWVRLGGLRGRTLDFGPLPPAGQSFAFEVDINSADWPDLATLPNIGPVTAKAIVADRERRGPFKSVHDLQRVNGIGPKTVERVRPYLRPFSESTVVLQKNKNGAE